MASRFWVGGTGTWDASDTTHWAATSAGAGGASVPVAGDTVTFDGSSGGGTVTVNHASLSIASLTTSAWTGTLDFSANNNNVAITGNSGLVRAATAANTLNYGSGTWTVSGTGTFTIHTSGGAGLTSSAASATFVFSSTLANPRTIAMGGTTIGTLTVNQNTNNGSFKLSGNSSTISTFNVGAGNYIVGGTSGHTYTVTTFGTLTGTASDPITFAGADPENAGSTTFSTANAVGGSLLAFRCIAFAGGGSVTVTDSFDLGGNSIAGGGTLSITGPSGGSGGFPVLGGPFT